jgi:redox-sensitive bicupin YhaK (pirin superfamily)
MDTKIDLIISGREKDLGGFSVRRLLPFAGHRMVGPFIFFDHMGPANLLPDHGMDVRPHPHIGLATVTYLFAGAIRHRDSLGSDQLIEPGAINWMTAGKGIVHSERTPEGPRHQGSFMNGLQCWVALPEEFEETTPSFHHYEAHQLPAFKVGEVEVKLLVGSAYGQKSPVVTHSNLFYLECTLKRGSKLKFPSEGQEAAVYVVDGRARIDGAEVAIYSMAVAKTGADLEIEALEDSKIMILGGSPVGERQIFWNFVSSSEQRMEEAKNAWKSGPSPSNSRFHPVPGDDAEFIPLP